MKYALAQFPQNGFFVFDLDSSSALNEVRSLCIKECEDEFGSNFTSLESYHLLKISPENHDNFQYRVFKKLNESKLHYDIVNANLPFFRTLLGPDIDIQTGLYLRISRPKQVNDNIGFHRDTDYGNSAYEISFSFPLVDVVEGAALGVVPESHRKPNHNTTASSRGDVAKGSFKNKMGFLYAPKTPTGLSDSDVQSVPLKFGQALCFTLGLIHGQVFNNTNVTRWSIDFRLKNRFHPLTKNLKEGYYSKLTTGDLSSVAKSYYDANDDEVQNLVFKN